MPAFELSIPSTPPHSAGNGVVDQEKLDLVISGLSGRLPESDNITEFRDHLMNKEDMVTDDGRRWLPGLFGLPQRSGKLKDLTKFDATFFGVHPKQADTMDPQMRMLLEVTHEAIVDAGVNPQALRGSQTGVFIGASGSEAREGWSMDPETTSGYSLTGGTTSMIANRISYAFDLQGPSYVVDTACSSSLLAMDQAVHAIRTGLCEAAIVGGTSISIRPNTALQFNRMSMLSPDGTCKSFDASGNGYTRSEAVVAILIQKSDVCHRNYAHIVETGNNSDGFKEQGITFPSGEQQKQLLKSVYANANLDPASISYVEAHGTGTKVGDPQEVNTIADVFCKGRMGPLYIGSVKSNMGHPEPSSGLAALAKVLITFEEGIIPPNLHYKNANPDIPGLSDGRLSVVTEAMPLPGDLVAINSFGFGGSNVHAILKRPASKRLSHPASDQTRLCVYGGRTPEAVERVLSACRERGQDMNLHALMNQSAHQATSSLPHRGYTLVNSETEISQVESCSAEKRPVWFIFSGMGTQWNGMARKMMSLDLFRSSIMKSDALLKPLGLQLYEMLMNGSETIWDDILHSFVAVAAIQVALVDTLRSVGIKPDGILGHSVGELGCGYADGCLTADETVLAAYWRGRCVKDANLPKGAMAAVGLTWEEAKRRCPEGVVPACHNSVDTVTISGPAPLVDAFVQELKDEDVFAKHVNSANIAFHSYFMEQIAPSLNNALKKVMKERRLRSSRWISSSIPESLWNTDLARYSSHDYYTNNLVSPVLFQEALHHIPRNALTIEIAPHCLLQSILKRSLGPDCIFTGLMKRNHDNNLEFFLSNLGKCYMAGINLNPLNLYAPVQFPVERGTPMISPLIQWDHSTTWDVPKAEVFYAGDKQGGSVYEIDCAPDSDDRYLTGHKIDGRVLFPATGYLVLAWRTLAKLAGQLYDRLPVVFEDVVIHRATILPSVGKVFLEVNVMAGSGDFEVLENGTMAASGTIRVLEDGGLVHKFPAATEMANQAGGLIQLSRDDVYKELRLRGYDYGPSFQGILATNNHASEGLLSWSGQWISFLDTMLQMCVLSYPGRSLRLPTRIKSVRIDPTAHKDYIKTKDGGVQVVDCVVDSELSTVTAGAVEMLALHATVAPRRQPPSATLEEFRFTPYQRQNVRQQQQQQSLERYLDDCLAYAAQSYGRVKAFPQPLLMASLCTEKLMARAVDFDVYESDADEYSLLAVLAELFNTENLHESRSLLLAKDAALKRDVLLNGLLDTEYLKPCLDIVMENCLKSKLKVMEINEYGHIGAQVVPLMMSHPQMMVDYTLVTSDPAKHDEAAMETLGGKIVRWNLTESDTIGLEAANLVVARHVLSDQRDVSSALQRLRELVVQNGFLLVQEITENFLLGHALYGLAGQLETGPELLGAAEWCACLRQNGFEVVSTTSDGLLSTVFLCRRVEMEDDDEEVVSGCDWLNVVSGADDDEYEWVNELRERVLKLETASPDSRLWLVADTENSGIAGLMNCIRKEPGGEKVRCVFISNTKSDSERPDIDQHSATFAQLVRKDLVMNVYRDGVWGSFRYLPAKTGLSAAMVDTEHAYVNVLTRGDLSSLRWIESPLKHYSAALHPTKELCDVYYTSLNFRDVMLATGKLPPDAIPGHMAMQDCILGMEFSGRDSTGRRIMGLLAAKGLATSVDASKQFLWSVPDEWTLQEAATVPVVYSTVFYALVIRGRIRRGDRVLIHSGSGGVGQAAIAIALHYGCDVYTTVGTQEKRDYIRARFAALKADHISNSRDTSFEYDILKSTRGKGVDVVLNSLAADKLQASLRVLAPHGRFLEIGKFDLSNNTSLGMSLFLKNVSFHGILLDALFEDDSVDWELVSGLVSEGIKSGAVQPLRTTVFDRDELEAAFRYMAQGKHIGKVLIQIREEESSKLQLSTPVRTAAIPRTACHPDKVYIITGGLGGFGLELANWLIERGAVHLVLTSRSGLRTGYQSQRVRTWRELGVNVSIVTTNTSTEQDARQLIEEAAAIGPIGGIFHLAMVLNDAFLDSQTPETFRNVCETKVQGTINLDVVSRALCANSLEQFVTFSSIVSGRGNIGQTNYGYANSVMERICEQRVADGLPGLSVQWGAIGDVGVILNMMGDNDTEIAGTLPQRIYSCLSTLDQFLNQSCPVMSSFVIADKQRKTGDSAGKSGNLVSAIANILGLKDSNSISQEVTFADLGLDSLMGVEVKQTLERDFDMALSIQEIRQLTFNKLRAFSDDTAQPLLKDSATNPAKGAAESGGGLTSLVADSDVFQRYDPEQLMPLETLVHLNADTCQDHSPLFVVHPLEGSTHSLKPLAAMIQRPLIGLQCTAEAPVTSIETLAGHYIRALRASQATGPYHLAGYSMGAMIAFEMALQMQAAGLQVDELILLDGSHTFVSAYTAQHRTKLGDHDSAQKECQTMSGFLMQFMEIDHSQLFEELLSQASFDDRIQTTTQKLMAKHAMIRSAADVSLAARSFHDKLVAATRYTPGQQYTGDVTLVRAKDGLEPTKALGEDYDLEQVCQGSVHIHTVDGNHMTFIQNQRTADIINVLLHA